MKMKIVICFFFVLFLGFFGKCAKKQVKKGGNEAQSLTKDVQYGNEECLIMKECKYCSFVEIKQIKECITSGYIQVKRCTKINVLNPSDKFVYMIYEPCALNSFNINPAALFILCCSVLFAIFMNILKKHKEKMQNKLFEKIEGKGKV